MTGPLFLGLDLSTQQLKGVIIDANLDAVREAHVEFDQDLPLYGTKHGVHVSPEDENVITAPVAMWLAAIDRLLEQLAPDLGAVVGISGAGMQHGTVLWSAHAEQALRTLDSTRPLVEQAIARDLAQSLDGALVLPYSPNWQDSSTQAQCEQFEAVLGGAQQLAEVTGSRAHHRFSGPQILKVLQVQRDAYEQTARISLVSSFLASVFLGRIAPIDVADACGMNLLDMQSFDWQQDLLAMYGGAADNLRARLGSVNRDSKASLGRIAPYFVQRYGFGECSVYPFTGDNPATMLSLPLKENEAIVSLGTSTTCLMSTASYRPHSDHHFMHHPTTPGLYMFMLCFTNGSLAREQIRNAIDPEATTSKSWAAFDTLLKTTPVLGKSSPNSPAKIGLYFSRREILPAAKAGTLRALYSTGDPITILANDAGEELWDVPNSDARAIVESQLLSICSRIQDIAPRGLQRIYLAGGAACNDAIAEVCGDILGGHDGVWRLHNVGASCAAGAANRAAWSWQSQDRGTIEATESFEAFLNRKWTQSSHQRMTKICNGHNEAVWQRYAEAVDGLKQLEKLAICENASA